MPKATKRDPIYRGRRFSPEIIELCVRWYITYRLSYRDLAEMVAERGIAVSHTTIMRWVLNYVPVYECRWAGFARAVNSSWRMDETAVSVRDGRYYLYRAVDRNGKSVESLLSRNSTRESVGLISYRQTRFTNILGLQEMAFLLEPPIWADDAYHAWGIQGGRLDVNHHRTASQAESAHLELKSDG